MNARFFHSIFDRQYTRLLTDDELPVTPMVDEDDVGDHRQVSSLNAFWNVCNSIQGVAILAMPYVVKGGGWWSVITMIVVAVLSNYTGQILLECHYERVANEKTGEAVKLRTKVSFADVGDAVWPKYGRDLILIVQVLELLFMATLYPIVAASVVRNLCPWLHIPSSLWVLVFGLVILPNVFIRHVNHISVMSTLTVVSAGFVFVVVNLYCLTEYKRWQFSDLKDFSLNEYVASCGVIVASYSSQMYLSVIEAGMQRPQDIGKVMNLGYIAMTILKIGIGVIAYVTFGDDTSQVVTLNLPRGALLSVVNVVVLLLALSSYTLPMFTIFEIIEKDSAWLIKGDQSEFDAEMIPPLDIMERKAATRRTVVRLSLIAVTLLMAVTVPHFCLVLAFIGSFTGTFLELVFPCVFHLKLKFDEIKTWQRVLDSLIIVISFFFMGIGTYYSGAAMERAFRLHTKEIWTVD